MSQNTEFVERLAADLKLKSSAYTGFVLLCNVGADEKVEYAGCVKCTTCSKVMKHDIHSSGTSHLTRHMTVHGATAATAAMDKAYRIISSVGHPAKMAQHL